MRETEIFRKYMEGLKAVGEKSMVDQVAAGQFEHAQQVATRCKLLETLIYDIDKLDKDPTEFVKEYFK